MTYNFEGSLNGKVALVTGASRGIGKGIATILVQSGATVYITGRKSSKGDKTVKDVAEEGECIHIFCDHYNDDEVDKVFETIDQQQNGKLDILALGENRNKKFYETEPDFWDKINNVGLRSNYYCSTIAAKMMVKRKSGFIVQISSIGGIMPLFGVAYGVGKEGNDRMAQEMGRELKSENICCISLWPGLVKTETMEKVVEKNPEGFFAKLWKLGEDPTLSGKAVAALAADKKLMSYSGKVVVVAEAAEKYGFKDVGDVSPLSFRSLAYMIERHAPGFGRFIPSFIKVPAFILTGYFNKF